MYLEEKIITGYGVINPTGYFPLADVLNNRKVIMKIALVTIILTQNFKTLSPLITTFQVKF
jgi:hypothetical protein